MTVIDESFAQEFGLMVYEARQALGMSQKELAQRIGAAQGTICMYESGKRIPNIKTLALLCDALWVSANQLLPKPKHVLVVPDEKQMDIYDVIGE